VAKKKDSPWFWELRGDGEWLPPEISSIGEGWTNWEGPLSESPSRGAEIFAREVIQNFVDAARDGITDTHGEITPTLTFRFLRITGTDAMALAGKLGLQEHADRFKGMSEDDRNLLRIGASKVLAGNFGTIELLVVSESGTSGMYGPWQMDDQAGVVRKMRSALMSTVGDRTTQGLGAYGEGKRAVIAASVPRTILAYTCFKSREETGDVDRRFLGATYWRVHNEADRRATGLALLGQATNPADRSLRGRPVPLDNADADAVLQDLGIPFFTPRSSGDVAELGTSQVFIEPSVSPSDIAWAIERNWWPLLEDGNAHFEVFDYEGNEIEIAPDRRRELQPFISAYRTLRGTNPPRRSETMQELSESMESRVLRAALGKLCLVADTGDAGWSWEDRETNRTLVALIRNGMIIEYETFPRHRADPPPFIRGVFVVDSATEPEAEKHLRLVEPPLHNFWHTDKSRSPESAEVAEEVYIELTKKVREFKRRFREVLPPNDNQFQIFGEVFNVPDQVVATKPPGPAVNPPPPTKDPWENQSVEAQLEVVDVEGGLIRAAASRALSLKDDFLLDNFPVVIRVGWEVLEDGGRWAVSHDLDCEVNAKTSLLRREGDAFVGQLVKEPFVVEWKSNPYSSLWTVRPFVLIEKQENEDA